jgi:hypothetical protein
VVRAFYRLRAPPSLTCTHAMNVAATANSAGKRPRPATRRALECSLTWLARIAQPLFVHHKCTKQNFCSAKGAAYA